MNIEIKVKIDQKKSYLKIYDLRIFSGSYFTIFKGYLNEKTNKKGNKEEEIINEIYPKLFNF